jgi:DNA-directed RNA polymerase specialized sigma24 family protein
MQGSERVGAQPPTAAASDLQPDVSPTTADLDSTHAALTELHHAGFEDAERVEAEWAADRLAHLQAAREMVEELRRAGFEGKGYDVFKGILASYGYPVLQAWIRRREIYRLTYERGRPVQCSEELRDHLTRDADDRQELAMETVAHALVHFRERALLQGTWDPEGGASLTTFFIGAALQVFPNVFRTWSRQYHKGRGLVPAEDTELDDRVDDDPVTRVCVVETFREALQSAAYSDRLRHTLAARLLQDARYREIAERWGTTEEAIKQQVHRWRKHQTERRDG